MKNQFDIRCLIVQLLREFYPGRCFDCDKVNCFCSVDMYLTAYEIIAESGEYH